MSRGYRFAVCITLWLFAVTIHYVGIELFAPTGQLWGIAGDAVANDWVGVTWREDMYKLFAQFIPLLTVGFSLAWLFFSEYEAQTSTQVMRRGGRF